MVGRPQKLNADYFTHDKDMRDDPKVKALRRKYGLEGYAIYVMMNEVLTDSDYFIHNYDELSLEILAGDFNVETDLLIGVLEYCDKLQLFTIENNTIRNFTLEKRFQPLLSKRERDRERIIAVENTQSKVKYSKEEYSKEEKEPPTEAISENKSEQKCNNVTPPDWCISLAKQIYANAQKTPKPHELTAGAKFLNDLNRLDGYEPDEIQKVIEWGISDKRNGFNWSNQIKSPAGLRNKRNGAGDLTKFEKIRAEYLAKNPHEPVPAYLRNDRESRVHKPMWEE